MSEVVRNYSWGRNSSKRRRLIRRHGKGIAKFLFPVLVVTLIIGIWTTRDNYPASSFIAKENRVEVYIDNPVARRRDLLNSNILGLLPENFSARKAVEAFSGDLPIPEWLLNNVSSGLCHISSPDLDHMDQAIVVTSMTRIGCIAERIARFLPAVERDFAGGLHVYHVRESSIFYAVRGRTFVLSASRDSLIQALTRTEAEALTPEDFEERLRLGEGADIFCRILPEAVPLPGRPFDQLSFAVRFEPESTRFLMEGEFSSDFLARYGALFPEKGEKPLPAPFDSIASVSLDFGKPLPEVLDSLAQVFQDSSAIPDWIWESYKLKDGLDAVTSLQPLIASIIQASGPRFRLGWFGIDSNEMVPAPLLAATCETDTDQVLLLFEGIPELPPSQEEIDLVPRVNAEQMLVHVPFVGGPNLKPTLLTFKEGIIFSSSLPLALDLQKDPRLVPEFKQQGNLYICVKPPQAAKCLLEAARELAFSGLLRGYTSDSLELAAKPWVTSAATVREAEVLASWTGGSVRAEIKLSMESGSGTEEGNAGADVSEGEVVE